MDPLRSLIATIASLFAVAVSLGTPAAAQARPPLAQPTAPIDATVTPDCVDGAGRITIVLSNDTDTFPLFAVAVDDGPRIFRTLSPNSTQTLTRDGLFDGDYQVDITLNATPHRDLTVRTDCGYVPGSPSLAQPIVWSHEIRCVDALPSDDRAALDLTITNDTDEIRTYTIDVDFYAPRFRTLAAGETATVTFDGLYAGFTWFKILSRGLYPGSRGFHLTNLRCPQAPTRPDGLSDPSIRELSASLFVTCGTDGDTTVGVARLTVINRDIDRNRIRGFVVFAPDGKSKVPISGQQLVTATWYLPDGDHEFVVWRNGEEFAAPGVHLPMLATTRTVECGSIAPVTQGPLEAPPLLNETPTPPPTPVPPAVPPVTPDPVPTAVHVPTPIPVPGDDGAQSGPGAAPAGADLEVSVACRPRPNDPLDYDGTVGAQVMNTSGAVATYAVRVGSLDPRTITIGADDAGVVTRTGRPDGTHAVTVSHGGVAVASTGVLVDCDRFGASHITIDVAVTCQPTSDGSGHDGVVAVTTTSTATQPARVVVTVGDLTPRVVEVPSGGVATTRRTGRPDSVPIVIVETTAGKVLYSNPHQVRCDDLAPEPTPEAPEPVVGITVDAQASCADGSGPAGIIDVTVTNTTNALVVASVTVGALDARSFSIGAGFTHRSVRTGRPDGTTPIVVTSTAGDVATSVEVDCAADDPVTWRCVGRRAVVAVIVTNDSADGATHQVDVGQAAKAVFLAPGATSTVRLSGRPDGVHEVVVKRRLEVIATYEVVTACSGIDLESSEPQAVAHVTCHDESASVEVVIFDPSPTHVAYEVTVGSEVRRLAVLTVGRVVITGRPLTEPIPVSLAVPAVRTASLPNLDCTRK